MIYPRVGRWAPPALGGLADAPLLAPIAMGGRGSAPVPVPALGGYVLEGSITLRFADGHEETNRAGDLYYWPAGHTGWTDEGVTFLEFSPTAEILPVLDHLSKQLAG